MMRKQFWKKIPVEQLTNEEWEAICDGCGKCCLIKLQEDSRSVPLYTSLACEFLNIKNCRCKFYSSRNKKRNDCLILTPKNLKKMVKWLPNTCAYRLVQEKKDLPNWHHLNSEDINSVHTTGNSIQNLAINETFVDEADFEKFITEN